MVFAEPRCVQGSEDLSASKRLSCVSKNPERNFYFSPRSGLLTINSVDLRNSVLRLFAVLGIKSGRTKNIARHIGWSLVYRAGSIAANFALVPLTINYLDTENYGVWLTLSSFIGWFSFFDIGLGNGLRNKFAEAKALGNLEEARAFVSTAYFAIGGISLVAICAFLCATGQVSWEDVFNAPQSLGDELDILLPIIFILFCVRLALKLVVSLYQADQNHSIENKVQFFTQVPSLVLVYGMTKMDHSSLMNFGIAISGLPVVILVLFNIIGFRTTLKEYKPTFSSLKVEYLREITGLGFQFFIIQIAVLVLLTTDNFVISQVFGPEEVVPYHIAFKYFSIVTIGYSIVVAPYRSSITEAFAKGELDWIKGSVTNIQKLWLVVPLALLFMVLVSEWAYVAWVGEKVSIPLGLTLSMALYVLLHTFNMVYVNFINGVSKIKLQLIASCISIIINIPLSVLLSKYCGLGVKGVILATCFSLGYSVILYPIQYLKVVNNKAKGIWNR